MQAQVIRMRFDSAVRIGQSGVGIEKTESRLSADTLFAALLTQLAYRDPSLVDSLVSAFPRRDGDAFEPGSPPFLLSSTFPFAGDVLFFPVPALPPNSVQPRSDRHSDAKKLKRAAYVSAELFVRLLQGGSLADLSQDKTTRTLQENTVWLTDAEYESLPPSVKQRGLIWKDHRRPRVAVDRLTRRSEIFHHGEVFFGEGCGLWFAIHWRDPEWQLGNTPIRTVFNALLDDLSVMGIGQLRSYGLGSFRYDLMADLPFPDADSLAVSLSRFHPAPVDMEALAGDDVSYSLTQVGGRMNANGRTDRQRLVVGMLREGAVLNTGHVSESVLGCLVNAADPGFSHPSWRYGLMFPVGLAKGT